MSDTQALTARFNQLAHEFGVLTFKADRVKAEMAKISTLLIQIETQERAAAADKALAEQQAREAEQKTGE
jgi:hypothetical protein